MRENRYARTLRRAIEIAGGERELAALLRTSPELLAKWLAGELAPPIKAYLAALELVMREAGATGRRSNPATGFSLK